MRKKQNRGFEIYAVYWTDATKADDLEERGQLPPANGVAIGIIQERGKDYLTLVREFFDDGSLRDVVTIPCQLIKQIVKVGKAPQVKDVFGK